MKKLLGFGLALMKRWMAQHVFSNMLFFWTCDSQWVNFQLSHENLFQYMSALIHTSETWLSVAKSCYLYNTQIKESMSETEQCTVNSYNLQTYVYVIQYKSCCKRRIKPGRSCFCVIRNLLHPLDKKHNNFWLNRLPKINTNNKEHLEQSSTSEASKQMQGWRIICGNLAELVRNADSEWDKVGKQTQTSVAIA